MSFTNNTRDEVTLIGWKHNYLVNRAALASDSISNVTRELALIENQWIRDAFAEVRDRNAKNLQAGSYEAIGTICDEFFRAAEPAQVG